MTRKIFIVAAFILGIGGAFASKMDKPYATGWGGSPCSSGTVNDDCTTAHSGATCTLNGTSAYDSQGDCQAGGSTGILKRTNP